MLERSELNWNFLSFNKDVCDLHRYFWKMLYYCLTEMTLITCFSKNICEYHRHPY